ncbi:titin-like isoform X2 [Aricia agestis]|uniref:titin-like isoform X2 n=1 Tax=Aricia agestis TaxID=91739 RepID=UPI001C2046FF|nr:titin-like isoform X2 [Aricia agestis]
MCEESEITYLDGDVVWVKLGSCWWPGEVVGPDKLPPDLLASFKKPPIAVVKFYQEDTYEYVKNHNSIFKYNCSRKNEFIKKGMYMYRNKKGNMEKFPDDVVRAEVAVDGDKDILTREEFQEEKKESYAGLFGDPKKNYDTAKKGKSSKGRVSETTPIHRLRHKSDYKVHILVQNTKSPRQSTETAPSPSTSRAGSEPLDSTPQQESKPQSEEKPVNSTPIASTPGTYACHSCNFITTRLNVLIMHNKSHSSTFSAYTPSPMSFKKKPVAKSPKASPDPTATPKSRKPKQQNVEKATKKQAKKRVAEPAPADPEVKKSKTDVEIKSSLLADWDDAEEESNDESSTAMAGSPEIPVASESPAIPTEAELPSAQVPEEEVPPKAETHDEQSTAPEKPELSNDAKYDFCEDEDWPVETDVGRKIPRVKNPSKRKEDSKSLSIDDDEMAKEVAELLSKSTLPELPAIPETFKEEENFPEPSIVKSPDKQVEKVQPPIAETKGPSETPPTKTIFKTKTFFRSRHSRSQDAIGKYVAEQLNAAERLDMSENDINGADITSLIEPRISPPVEHVKVARLAPKIQLKKMKAEAAQLLEREKYNNSHMIKEQSVLDSSIVLETVEKPSQAAEEPAKTMNEENILCENKNTVNKNVQLDTTEIIEDNRKACEIEFESVDNKVKDITEKEIVKADNIEDKSEKVLEQITDVPENITSNDKDNTTLVTITEPMEVIKPFMSESTASAVDALLSVSRETDRVTKVISDDPPEDLFEDDNKDSKPFCVSNGINENHHENDVPESMDICPEVHLKENIANDNIINVEDNSKVKNLSTGDEEITKDTSVPTLEDSSFNKDKTDTVLENNDTIAAEKDTELENIDTVVADKDNGTIENNLSTENVPSESDLQVAQALINLPSTNSVRSKLVMDSKIISPKNKPESYTLLNTILDEGFKSAKDRQTILTNTVSAVVLPDGEISPNTETLSSRFETEQEKSENLNAAQSLVQMSESIDHKMNVKEINILKDEIMKPISTSLAQVKTSQKVDHVTSTTTEITSQPAVSKSILSNTNSPKLLKMLEEPALQKIAPAKNPVTKHVIVSGNDKILNFDIGKSLKNKTTKQKIIIRRAAPSKTLLNNVTESPSSHKIILTPSNKSQEGNSVTYSIKPAPVSPDSNAIVYQQKIRKISKPVSKLQKIKPQVLPKIEPKILSSPMKDTKVDADKMNTDAMFDINSMPVVLSDDILTPESIEKMPIVMSDGNIISTTSNPTKVIKKQVTSVRENVYLSPTPKTETKTLLVNSVTETKVTSTPNILSKSSKIRGTKPLLVIDKTGKQKLVMPKSEPQVKEVKSTTLLQPAPQSPKTEKFIILPTTSAQRPVVRTQKIVIDPQTRKAHVLVGKGPEAAPNVVDNKPVSAKLISSAAETNSSGNTVMIITNAQGAQSRIVLTSEHEKILFPNKQQPNVTQLKKIVHRISPNNGAAPKQPIAVAPSPKTAPRIVQKQKGTVITSKGQLIAGGRAPAPTPNIAPAPAPLPEIRPAAPKRIIAAEPKKLVQTIQKNSSEPLIFLQQKNGSVMQLTVAQFEHLQRTGQIVQKAPPPPPQEKIVVQKSITIKPPDKPASPVPKPRARRQVAETAPAAKRPKHEQQPIAPGRPVITQMPSLAPLTGTIAPAAALGSSSAVGGAGDNFGELDNFEELLPSTTIARQPELVPAPPVPAPAPAPVPAPAPAPAPAVHVDGQLLAIPGENFGGPPGSFYLCVEDNGTLTRIDNRPLVLEDNQLVPIADAVAAPQPERRDILEAALANSDVFHAEPRDEAPDFRDLNANVSVHCRVSETSTTLNQPIMTPVEVPSKIGGSPAATASLEAGLAVIGVTPQTVPTSLELPITVTDPRIAPRTTDPLGNGGYGALLASPTTGMTFVTTDEVQVSAAPISMPLLTDDDELGKSMPILTDAPLPAADLAHTS